MPNILSMALFSKHALLNFTFLDCPTKCIFTSTAIVQYSTAHFGICTFDVIYFDSFPTIPTIHCIAVE